MDGGEREEAKETPGFFTYSMAAGEGVVRTSLRGETPCKVWEDLYLATRMLAVRIEVTKPNSYGKKPDSLKM